MSELVRERGVAAVTVAHVVGRSGVSRRTYYELFRDREGCLLAAFDHAAQRAARVVLHAYQAAGEETGSGWEERIRAALAALLRFLDDEPALGGLLVVDALAGERPLLERRTKLIDALVDAVHEGARAGARLRVAGSSRNRAGGGPRGRGGERGQGRIVAEGVVGAVLAVVHARLLSQSQTALSGLVNPLMGIIVLPYLGPAAAERELARPTPRVRRRAAPPTDPLRQIDMRLTYRTVRVLLAISELDERDSPPSGRQVADAAGITDQGQMSKLLTRLAHLGLIHNEATATGKGEPNAWVLTPQGRDVERAIRAQTAS